MQEDLLKIINHYEIGKQLKYIHTEYYELDEAIITQELDESGYNYEIKHIAEEIADVMVMLKQFQYYYNIDDEEIENIMKEKIKRQLERIDEENKK